MQLKDASLVKDKAYVDGTWIAADAGAHVPSHQPGQRQSPGNSARPARGRNPPRDRSRERCMAGVGREDGEGNARS